MVLDTSALLAILFNEPERRTFAETIEAAEARRLSAASFVESSMILESRHGAEGVRAPDRLLATAREAFRQFAKGRHPAGLNSGDCFSYALAKCRAEPLLFKGGNFSRTDVLIP